MLDPAGGSGRIFVLAAIETSIDAGYKGRLGLHSLPQAEPFYETKCGMTRLGPDSSHQNLTYYEMTENPGGSFPSQPLRTMKIEYPKEWFVRSAEIEGDAEVGAGALPTQHPTDNTTYEKTCAIDTRIALGQFVELWRRNKGWNAEKLANVAGIDTEEILEIEHDPHCAPEPDAIFKLATVFEVPSPRLMEIAGLVENRTPRLREEAIRFAARSESLSVLSELEKEALEAFVTALTSQTE